MTDISKCVGTDCPLKDQCYRYTAPASEHWQAYIAPPYNAEKGDCDMFWLNERMDLQARTANKTSTPSAPQEGKQ